MKKAIVLSLLVVTSVAFAGESKVICDGDIKSLGSISSGTLADRLNDKIASAAKDGFTQVSAPSLSFGPSSGIHDQYGGQIYSMICVTITKP